MLSTYSIIFTASDGTVIDGELETAAPLPTGGWTLTLNAAGNGFAAAPVVVIPPAPPPVTQVATPVFSPLPPGPGTIPLKVTITTPTIAAAIYYTTDGVKPTYPPTGATKLYNPATGVVIDTTAYDPYCVYAIAVAPGLTNSALATGNYVFSAPTTVATPTFSPVGGTVSVGQKVTLACATAGASIYYTTNGSAPTTSSTLYTGPIAVTESETINAIAVVGTAQSAVTTSSPQAAVRR